ncbi:hypothetical protein BDZ85DRAFT_269520 [Elsinoe ampelina]|uniref:AMP-activated protein kinase glycogen-binding domain-containing protein n=1 Tax=Elsinoe ampelina TaxID=302913 RepID=A0A6A6G076_9PEZI|nr:hypothetical protein BDZ85DRAFT_269520 [Elsinoe ampelina]
MSTDTAATPAVDNFLPLVAAPAKAVVKTLSSKPSWIGKPPVSRAPTPGLPVMKRNVRISYHSKGLRPPVFIATSLTDPQWTPKELHSEVQEDGELEFWRQFEAEEGEYQYKFRLGPGDWWALDESKPIVEDEHGNRNNTLIVGAPKPNVLPRSDSRQSIDQPQSKPTAEASPRPSLEARRPSTESVRSTISATGLKISNAEPRRPEEARIEDKQKLQQQTRLGPAEPLTPPLTPDMWDKVAVDTSKFQPFPAATEIKRPASVASHYSDKSIEEAIPTEEEKKEDKVTVIQDEPKQSTGLIAQMKMFLITLGTWMLTIAGGGLRMTGLLAIAVGIAAIVYKIRDLRDSIIPAILSFFYPSTYGQRRNDTDDTSMV